MPTINKSLAILAVLAFFLPFIAISCNGKIIPGTEIKGAKLAQCAVTTCTAKDFFDPKALTGGLLPGIDTSQMPAMPEGKGPTNADGLNLILFAAIAAVFAALILFLKARPGELLSGVASVASIAFLFLFRNKLLDAVAPQLHSAQLGGGLMLQIQLQFSSGFWLSIVMSAASAILAFKGTGGGQPSAAATGAGGATRNFTRPPAAGASPSSGAQMGARCPSCSAANPAGNKFCLSCGGSLAAQPAASQPKPIGAAVFCSSCNAANPVNNKFCLSCGSALNAPAQTSSSDQPANTSAATSAGPAAAAESAPVALAAVAGAESAGNPAAPPSVSETPILVDVPYGAIGYATAPASTAASAAAAAPATETVPAAPEVSIAKPAATTDQLGGDTSWMSASAATTVASGAAAATATVAAPLTVTEAPVSDDSPTVALPSVTAAEDQQPASSPQSSAASAPAATAVDNTPASAPQLSSEPVCTGCGLPVPSDAKFCRSCGTPVRSAASVAAPAFIYPATRPASSETVAPTPLQAAAQPRAAVAHLPSQSQPFETPSGGSGKMWIIVVLLLAVLGTAGWFVWKHFAGPDVSVNAFLQKTHVAAGGKTVFQVTVSGSTDTAVGWSIQEGDKGGQITPQGTVTASGQARSSAIYTAPTTAGTYHVVATSHANSSRSAKIEVIVGGPATPTNLVTDSQATSTGNPAASSPFATQIVGTWRGPTSDMRTVIGADGTIALNSDSDPQKNLHGSYKFSDNSHLDVDFGNGDVRKWEILGITGQYMRVVSQSKSETTALIFAKM